MLGKLKSVPIIIFLLALCLFAIFAGYSYYDWTQRTCCVPLSPTPTPSPVVEKPKIWEGFKEACQFNGGTWKDGVCYIPEEQLLRMKKDEEACLKKGGTWGRLGLSLKEECNLPTSDGGKKCTDSSECDGSCIGEREGVTSGKCSDRTIVKGCYPFVENGKASGILCAD